MRNFTLIFLACFVSATVWSQKKDETAVKYAKTVTKKDLKKHLTVIASDEMEGRDTGSPGQKKAAKYIADHFKALGLLPPVKTAEGKSYFQKFDLVKSKWKDVSIATKKGSKTTYLTDVYALGSINAKVKKSYRVVYMGDGNKANYEKVKVKGKPVAFFIDGVRELRKKRSIAQNAGASQIFMIVGTNQKKYDEVLKYLSYYVKRWTRGELKSKKDKFIVMLSPKTAANLFKTTQEQFIKKETKIGTKSVKFKLTAEQEVKTGVSSENVLGFLEGGDKKKEVLVITAHYDHIGKRGDEIYNGADDDGSGTVTVLELAEAFAKAKKEGKTPLRSILFMTVSGEEKGLLGSSYYTDFDPIFSLKNTVANLNIDMVGRIDDRYKDNPDYVYVIGSDKLSSELHNLNEEANKQYTNIKLDYKYNDEKDPNRFYYRSDHYNFAKNNIPIIFYFNGTHADYHKPTDTIEKIHFGKMQKIGRLVFHTAWKIANRENRLKVDKVNK
ncbi:M28 family peptidase [uncultured Microscilla sp.]|uniref:M28 family peptidase n=1 Tax=uncultured Microscilla sp. TaxID=432653 RepID=UPI002623A4C4|nr:M28 family peptidase [uncultured Microscilla sp.]